MKVLLIDHHALFRDGLRHILQKMASGIVEILEADDLSDGLILAEQHPDLDMVLLELDSAGDVKTASIGYFHQRYPDIPLVVLSGEEDCRVIVDVLSQGASGYVCKSAAEKVLLGALKLVLAGGTYVPEQILYEFKAVRFNKINSDACNHSENYGLTKRRMEILRHLVAGDSNKEIAALLYLSRGTVNAHVAAIYQVLGVKSRIEAIRVARQCGLIDSIQD